MSIKDKPLYTCFIPGLPSAEVPFLPKAAEQIGINLEVEYHGCVVESYYKDEDGNKITDASLKGSIIADQNKEADFYYRYYYGERWFYIVEAIALKLLKEDEKKDNLPF